MTKFIIVSEIPAVQEPGKVYLTHQEARMDGFETCNVDAEFTAEEMRQGGFYVEEEFVPCPVCARVGGYCGGSGHPSCGWFADGTPVPLR